MDPQASGYSCLTICEHSGNTPLRFDDSLIGLGVISFNGCRVRQQAGDAFVLVRGMRQTNEYYCNTDDQPYSFMVRVVLLLANYHCPTTWEFAADIPTSDWQQTADWIAKYLNLASHIPDFSCPDSPSKRASHFGWRVCFCAWITNYADRT